MSVLRSLKKSLAVGASAATLSVFLPFVATPADAAVKCGPFVATIVGTNGQDVLKGTPGRDIINGLGGSDTIQGFGGDDVICGAGGNDTIWGHGGSDVIIGGPGNDNIFGNTGNNRIYAGDGDDEVFTDAGIDWIWGGNGDDELRGGAGNDQIYGEAGDDYLYGGFGHDYLSAGPDDDRIYAGPGADVMLGGDNGIRLDYCWGGADNDRSNGCERRTQQWATFFNPGTRNADEAALWNKAITRRNTEGRRTSWQSHEDRLFADQAVAAAKAERANTGPGQSAWVNTLQGGLQKFGSWGYRCDVVAGMSPTERADVAIAQMLGNENAPFSARTQWYSREGDRMAVSFDSTSDPNCIFWALVHESPVAPPS